MKILRGTQILYVCVLTSLVAGSANFAVAADINDLLNQKNDLQQQQQELQNAADNKAKEAKTIAGQIKGLNSDIQTTQGKIDETGKKVDSISAQITKLSSNIDVKTAELNDLKVKLNNAIREIYRSSSRSELQLLLGTDSLSESMNQMKYTESVETQVKTIHGQVLSAKNDLQKHKSDQEAKKAELDQLQSQQVAYQKSTQFQKSQQEKLKGMTVAQQQAYEERARKIAGEYARVSEQIRQILSENNQGSFDSRSGTLGYPWANATKDAYGDDYGFLVRECTSYVAWRWGGRWVRWWPEFDSCGGGDAKNWACVARARGMSMGSSPAPGAIAVWTWGTYGHVAYVESVNGDNITISDYNAVPPFGGQGNIRTISINNSSFGPAQYIYQ